MTSSTSGSRLDALRRSTDEKMIAGVSGGIARSLDVDPVIVRVGFVVLTFLGLAGPIIYLACWLLVPSDGKERGVLGDILDLDSDTQLRSVGLIVAGVLAVAAVLGDTAWGAGAWFWGPVWVLAWIAIPIGAVYWLLVVRPRENARTQRVVPPPPYQPPTSPGPAATAAPATPPAGPLTTGPTPEDTDVTESFTSTEPTAVLDAEPTEGPPRQPPPTMTPPRPPRPARERWSPALLLLTLSAIVAVMGALALWSVTQEPLDAAVYPAVALGIVAAGLLLGTRVGHPGALILVGLLIVPVLAATAVTPRLSAGNIDRRPLTAASISDPIEQGFGRVHIDLTAIDDPATLAGRTLEISNGLGDTTVIVPTDLDVEVDAALSAGGRIEVFDHVRNGQSPSLEQPSDAPGAHRIVINGTAGEIKVVRR